MIDTIYQKLKNVYTRENLTRITSCLIDAYRKKRHQYLIDLADKISEDTVHTLPASKVFSMLIKRYHPDRLLFIQNQLEIFYKAGDVASMQKMLDIVPLLQKIDAPPISDHEPLDIEFEYGYDEEDFDSIVTYDEMTIDEEVHYDEIIHPQEALDFLTAVKRKEYGNLDIAFGEIELTHMEGELVLSGYNLEDVSGIEFCKQLTGINLSDNSIQDISSLSHLNLLETLDLSSNQICDVSALTSLSQLQEIDISFNRIESLSALHQLKHLHYLNVIGNPLSNEALAPFHEKGIFVIS